MSSPLPPGWYEGVDPKHNRVYYFDKRTRRSTWTRPQLESVLDELKVSDGASAGQLVHQQAQDGANATRKPATSNEQLIVSNRQDDDPWVEVFSPEHNRVYYYNKVTRQSVWVDPRVAISLNSQPSQVYSGMPNFSTSNHITKQFGFGSNERHPSSIVDQIPALQDAWKGIEAARRALERERELHDMRMKGEWKNLRLQLKELKTLKLGLEGKQENSIGDDDDDEDGRDRAFSFEESLRGYAKDVGRRSRRLASELASVDGTPERRHQRRVSMEVSDHARQIVGEDDESLDTDSPRASNVPEVRGLASMLKEGPGSMPSIKDIGDYAENLDNLQRAIDQMQKEREAAQQAKADAKFVDEQGGYYNMLGVPVNADMDQLKKAYRKMAIKWHPDKNPNNRERAQEQMGHIRTAFETLSDPWNRQLYDWLKLEKYLQHVKIIDCFKNYLNTGFWIKKHGRSGVKFFPKKRFLWTDRDCTEIYTAKKRMVEPTKQEELKIKSVRVADITAIKGGMSTEVLRKYGSRSQATKYFSIITDERTLDLIAVTRQERNFLKNRLMLLVIDSNHDLEWLQEFYEQHGG